MKIKDPLKHMFVLRTNPPPQGCSSLVEVFTAPPTVWWQVYARLACSQAPQSQTISPPILGVWEAGDRKQAQALTLDPI